MILINYQLLNQKKHLNRQFKNLLKLKPLLEDTFTEIVKTDELIKLLPFGPTAKTTKDKTKLPDLPDVEPINKANIKRNLN